ncbi:MAG: hypothetical protein FWE48_03445 [Coriobacteriia bacterium]|nr:hypothetical protein [Coriobacteriia bacterium]
MKNIDEYSSVACTRPLDSSHSSILKKAIAIIVVLCLLAASLVACSNKTTLNGVYSHDGFDLNNNPMTVTYTFTNNGQATLEFTNSSGEIFNTNTGTYIITGNTIDLYWDGLDSVLSASFERRGNRIIINGYEYKKV